MLRVATSADPNSRPVSADQLAPLLGSDATLWIDVTGPDEAEAALMRDLLGLHPLAVEDTLNQRQRPKVEEYPRHLFLILNPGTRKEGEVDFRELDVFVGERLVVTVHPEEEPVIAEAERRLRRQAAAERTPGLILYALLDSVVDGYFPLLDAVGDEIEALEDLVLERPDHRTLEQLFFLKRQLVVLRKVVAPQRDVMALLARRDMPFVEPQRLAYHLRDVHDHLLRIADMVDTFRDLLSSGIDLYMSAVSNRLNRVVNRLTGVTVVVGVMAVITGFYGMNFERTWPPFEADWGVGFALTAMAGAAVAVLTLLRKAGWL